LQESVLVGFFAVERAFFLSGGAALAGFHLCHRETTDLDLFTVSPEAFERARIVLPHVVEGLGGTVTVRHDAPGFRRVVVEHERESLVVDLVRDVGPQLRDKLVFDGIVVDPMEEIFSNKLTTLVGRQEVRDLVDVLELERHGLHAEDYLADANAKDGGCTPATLAFLLRAWRIADDAKIPSGYTAEQLRTFKDDLAERLAVAAFPA
jgi:hypothetical protein